MTAAPKKSLALSPPPTPQTIGGGSSFPGIPTIASPPSSPRLKDKVCIITGCNSALGIGRASAYEFASAGAKALILSDFDISNLDNWKQDIEKLYPGTQVVVKKVDAGNEEDVKAVVKLAVDKWGRLDVFFANAGIGGTMERVYEVGKKEGKSEEEFMRTMKVNALRSVFLSSLQHIYGTPRLTVAEQCLPSNKARCQCYDAEQTQSQWFNHQHSISSWFTLQRWPNRLLCLKSCCHQHNSNISLPTRWHKHPLQRHLSRYHRDRHDGRNVQGCKSERQCRQDWTVESTDEGCSCR